MSLTLILGPSRWSRKTSALEYDRTVPLVRSDNRQRRPISPLEMRRILVRVLTSHGFEAVIFEDWAKRSKESHTHAFRRLLRSRPIRSYLIIWPRGASLLGLNWEFGILADRVESGRINPRRIVLLLEQGVARRDLESGILSLGETGNRTRYFEDLLTWGCPISIWSGFSDLCRRALRRSSENVALEREASPPLRRVSDMPENRASRNQRALRYDRLLESSQLTLADAVEIGRSIRRSRPRTA
jgi:hypothetical protein